MSAFSETGDGDVTETSDLVQRIAQMLSDKLAEEIVILDMREVVSYTDWFVIASGRNSRHTQSLAAELASA